MSKIFFLEGIQGSGKSTLAREMATAVQAENPTLKIFRRSASPDPLDICRLAYFTAEQFEVFISLLEDEIDVPPQKVSADIANYMSCEKDHILVNWYSFIANYNILYGKSMEYALAHELCDGKSGFELYRAVTYARWKNFSDKIADSDIYFFEGDLFQHPLSELKGYYMLNDKEIETFILGLLECVEKIPAELVYIAVSDFDIEEIITSAAQKRLDASHNWIDGFIKMTTTCNYGVENGFVGIKGAVKYCKERIRLEEMIMQKIPIPIKRFKRYVV